MNPQDATMDNQTPTPKQQIVERLKSAQSIVVTVNQSPKVDEIAAVLGLTRLLERFGKKVVAIISAPVPRELAFLKPERYIDDKIDRLRDFVIALDKEKADKLRYKAEDDVVKIFITPYKSAIDQSDLNFSQGDYNVDTVVVIGAASRENLDRVLVEHTSMLRDATVMSLSVGSDKATIGTPSWHEPEASSVAELLVSVADSLQSGLLDAQAAQALLASVVAATDGFRNQATTPKIMTIAAQLMASGADQQVIMDQLQHASSPVVPKKEVDKKPQNPSQAPHSERPTIPSRPMTPLEPVLDRPQPLPPEPPVSPQAENRRHATAVASGSAADSALAADAIDAVIQNAKQINANLDRSPTAVPKPTNPVVLSHKPGAASPALQPELNTQPEPPVLEQPTETEPTPSPATAPSDEGVTAARQAVEQAMSAQPQTGLPTVDPSIGSRTFQNDADVTISHQGNLTQTDPNSTNQ